MNQPATRDSGGALQYLTPENAELYRSMVLALPSETDDEATARLISQLVNATTADELNDPFQSDKTRELVGHILLITGIRLLESEYEGGLDFFLRVDAHDYDTGEEVSFSTGSKAIVLQLAAAWFRQQWPVRAKVIEAERAKRGRSPMQSLEVIATGRNADARVVAEQAPVGD